MALIAVDLTPIRSGGENGGAKVFVLELLKKFQAMASQHHFLLLTSSWNDEELSTLDAPNMKRLCVLGERKVQWSNLPLGRFSHRLRRVIRKQWRSLKRHSLPAQGILSEKCVDLLFCPFTAPKFSEPGMKVVSVVFDLQHRDYPQFFSYDEIDARDACMEDVRVHADSVICISEYVRKSAIKHLKIDPEKTCTIHICVQSRLSCTLDEQVILSFLNSMGIGQHPYMFYPANFWPHKNHKVLIEAFGIFLTKNPDCTIDLVLSGALESQQTLMNDVSDMGLSERVHFLGFISREQLAAVWQGSIFLVFPSLYEGFGIPVVEAMNFGKPVICSNVTCLPEVAGDAALYFDPLIPDDIVKCMEKVAFDEGLRGKMVVRGNKRSKAFNSDDMANEYLNHFHALINDG